MTTLKRALVIMGVGTGVAFLTLGAVWVAGQRGRTYYTNGAEIRVPAKTAPVRSILWQPASPLAGSVNSTSDEYEPRISADGMVMVFVRGKPGANTDLFQCRWTPQGWSEPAPIAPINTGHDELGPELSQDARSLYFYSDRPGGLGGYDIWVSSASEEGWTPPVNLGPGANSADNEYGPALAPGVKELFFASNRPRPGEPARERDPWAATVRETRDRHDYDLYRSHLGESGAEPAEAVVELNTPGDEGAPAISPAGDFLYFASDREGGRGGFDIYRARRAEAGFGAPENVGDAINSASSDLDPALSMDGFRLHFSSNRPIARAAMEQTSTEENVEDYGVWVSGSREVYTQTEASSASFAELLAWILPWLLLLLLALLLALIVPRLWIDDRLKARFRRLSLLAQCLLVSLALHVLIASLLTLWKVGSHISHMIAEAGGAGTRVVLASSAGDGDGFATQIRGELTSEQSLPDSPELGAADVAVTALDSPQVRTDAARTEAPETDPNIAEPESTRADAALPSDLIAMQAPEERSRLVAGVAPADAPPAAPAHETSLTPSPSAAPSPSAQPVTPALASASVSVEPGASPAPAPGRLETLSPGAAGEALASHASAPAAAAPVTGAPGVYAAAPSAEPPRAAGTPEATLEGTAGTAGVAGVPAAGVGQGLVRAERIEVGVTPGGIADGAVSAGLSVEPASATNRGSVSSTPGAPGAMPGVPALAIGDLATPGVSRADAGSAKGEASLNVSSAIAAGANLSGPGAAPTVSAGANRGERVEVSVGQTGVADAARAPGISSGAASSDERARAPGSPVAPVLAAPSAGAAVANVSIPGAGDTHAPTGGGASEITPSVPNAGAAGRALAPATLPAGASGSQGTFQTNPGASGPADTASAPLNVGRREAPGESSPAASVPLSTQGPARGTPSIAVALPIAEEPPAPKETFEQRAPEVRTEILEKMGGTAETEKAVGRALEWFSRHQEADGRWTGRRFDARCRECGGEAEFDSDAAMTGLALLCYLGAGHTHEKEGPHRAGVTKAIDFLLSRQEASGDLRRGETMYSQSIATVALCEAYAMTRDKRVGDAAKRAVEFMCDGVKRAASGRRDERSRADDTSVLGWQVMAMESARRCGFEIPDTTFRSAASFLDKVSTRGAAGRYSYRPGEAPSAAMTAEAMFVQQLMGRSRQEPRMEESAAFILQTPPRWKDGASTYYWYYATLALFQHQGDAWKTWNEALVPELLANQRKDTGAAGSWDPQDQWSRMGGRIYQTAVCTLSLEVYYRYKPVGEGR